MYNSNFDYIKIILCIMVVAIHSSLFPKILYPWLRLAVPLFFIFTSYFLFSKIKIEKNDKNKEKILKKYNKNNMNLYFSWLIILLIPTVYFRKKLFINGIIKGIILFVRNFFLSSTFVASWFLMASILGSTLIYYGTKRYGNKKIFIFASIIYLFSTFESSYIKLFLQNSYIINLFKNYENIFCASYNSFPISLIWIMIGKYFAENRKIEYTNKTKIYLMFSLILLYIEWLILYKTTGSYSNDCYLMLLPASIFIFNILVHVKPVDNKEKTIILRKISTVTYCLHGTIIPILCKILEIIHIRHSILVFLITLIICFAITIIIDKLVKNPKFRILKNLY